MLRPYLRLLLHYIKPRAPDPSLRQCVRERRRIDDRSTTIVHQHAGRAHLSQEGRIDEVPCGGTPGCQDKEDVTTVRERGEVYRRDGNEPVSGVELLIAGGLRRSAGAWGVYAMCDAESC
jgi:hypothetical protein